MRFFISGPRIGGLRLSMGIGKNDLGISAQDQFVRNVARYDKELIRKQKEAMRNAKFNRLHPAVFENGIYVGRKGIDA